MIIKFPESNQIPALRDLWKEAFGDTDSFLDGFFTTAFSPKRCRCVSESGEVLAALYWFDCCLENEKIAYIYAVATRKSHRGKGLCAMLMKDTHTHLKSLGFSGAVLVPSSEPLFGFYEKFGYKTCCYKDSLTVSAGKAKCEIREIDADEFVKIRRQFLPKGGIIQENENIAFLKRLASFYVGEDFLLAARKEKDTLFAFEFLGNPQAAGEILAALDCKKGTFKTNGEGKEFGMFLPFKENTPVPNYLGFAFD